jgi:Flp pilus assembly protein TadD
MLTLRFRTGVVWSAAGAVLMVLLPLVGVACGGGEPPRSEDEGVGRVAVALPPPLPELETTEAAEPGENTAVVPAPEIPKEVSYEEAEEAFLERRYGEAVDLFTRYTDRRSSNAWGFYMLGLSAWKAGEVDEAESAFERALELDPQHLKSWLNLARVRLDTNRPEEALEAIDEVLVIDSESSVAIRLQGRSYHQLGQAEEAIESYRRAILLDGEDVWSMNNMGLVLIEQERFGEALPPLARAVALQEGRAIFLNNLGIALENTGHYRAAEEAYKAAMAVDGTHEKAFVNLARAEVLEEDPSLFSVDLAELAQNFIDEVESWREAVAHRDQLDPIELEPVIVSAVDTTEIKH